MLDQYLLVKTFEKDCEKQHRPFNHFFVSAGFLGDKLGSYKGLTIFSVILAGFGPFGILWLHVDHHSFKAMSVNATGDNSTIESDMTVAVEQPHTLPLMLFFLLLGMYSTTSNDTLLEACGLTMCKKYGGDFARQKLWGNFYHSLQLFF